MTARRMVPRHRYLPMIAGAIAVALSGMNCLCSDDKRLPAYSIPAPQPEAPVDGPDAAVGPDAQGGRATLTRSSHSRYERDMPQVLQVLEVAYPPPAGSAAAVGRDFRFTWSYLDRYVESVVAMAASVPVARTVIANEVHKRFCPGAAQNCTLAELVAPGRDGELSIIEAPGMPSGISRAAALQACRSGVDRVLGVLKSALQSGSGAFVVGYVHDGFADFGASSERSSVHAFALHSIGTDGSLYFRDGADGFPVTYRLPPERTCDFLVAPTRPDLNEVVRTGIRWSVNAYEVKLQAGVAPFSPPPLATREIPPTPTTPPPVATAPPSDASIARPGEGWPLVPCASKTGMCDLGAYTLPTGISTRAIRRANGIAGAPDMVFLRVGHDASSLANTVAWLREVERRCEVSSSGKNSFSYRERDCPGGPLVEAVRNPGKAEVAEAARVARHFLRAMKQTDNDRAWLIRSIVMMVQEIPYELIPDNESIIDLRSPMGVLLTNGGDCDSKSNTAALMLRLAGVETAVVSYKGSPAGHAVLGIAEPGLTGVSASLGGKSYVLVEATTVHKIGDMDDTFAMMRRNGIKLDPKVVPAAPNLHGSAL